MSSTATGAFILAGLSDAQNKQMAQRIDGVHFGSLTAFRATHPLSVRSKRGVMDRRSTLLQSNGAVADRLPARAESR